MIIQLVGTSEDLELEDDDARVLVRIGSEEASVEYSELKKAIKAMEPEDANFTK